MVFVSYIWVFLSSVVDVSGVVSLCMWVLMMVSMRLPFFGASRPCGPAGWLAMLLVKAGDVETNPAPTATYKQVWICDICHRQIEVRKQISLWCNMIEHWVHLRCTGIRLVHYTDTF